MDAQQLPKTVEEFEQALLEAKVDALEIYLNHRDGRAPPRENLVGWVKVWKERLGK